MKGAELTVFAVLMFPEQADAVVSDLLNIVLERLGPIVPSGPYRTAS